VNFARHAKTCTTQRALQNDITAWPINICANIWITSYVYYIHFKIMERNFQCSVPLIVT